MMNRTSSLCAAIAFAVLTPLAFGQLTGTSTGTTSSAGDATNPLLGGTGTYGSAAQGSTTGGGAYSMPHPNTAAIDENFRRLDRNGDGVLSMEEFRAGYATPVKGGATETRKKRAAVAR